MGERLLIADSDSSKTPVTVEALQGQLDLIAEALDSSGDGFAIWKLAPEESGDHRNFSLVLINKAGAKLANKNQQEIIGSNLREVIFGPAAETLESLFVRALNVGHSVKEIVPSISDTGEFLAFENIVVPFGNDLVFATYRDVSISSREHSRLVWLTEHDYLTGMPNRSKLESSIAESLIRSQTSGDLMSFSFIDIDYFKDINDTYGHDVGDALLVNFVKRIRHSLPESALVARISGDEFGILLTNLKSENHLKELIDEVFSAMQRPFNRGQLEFSITCSAGCVLTNGWQTSKELMKLADQAMYQAKQAGRNRYKLENVSKTI
ncbi:MAG: hypothetical protein RLZZ56_177 [Actinomycetota bacterium]